MKSYEEELEDQIEAMRQELADLNIYEDVVDSIFQLIAKKIESAKEQVTQQPSAQGKKIYEGKLAAYTEIMESVTLILKKKHIL